MSLVAIVPSLLTNNTRFNLVGLLRCIFRRGADPMFVVQGANPEVLVPTLPVMPNSI
jgi:hypothetical protein